MKPLARSSIDKAMNFERPFKLRTEDTLKRRHCANVLPPFEAGLTTALRRAYAPPESADSDEFDRLLAKLA